mgnify:FL=1
MKKIYLVSNDKIWISNKRFTSNNDLNNIITCLNKNYNLNLICRKSNKKLNFLLNKRFSYSKFNQINEKKINIFLISITPYNFFVFFYLLLIKRLDLTGVVYLRSDGFLEYKIKYGFIGYYIYAFMFFFIKRKLKVLSCSKYFTNVKSKKILHPSELNSFWFKRSNGIKKFKTDFIYVGRFKKEKGSIFLVNLFKKHFTKYKLTIVGTKKESIHREYYNKNIRFIGPVTNIKKMIHLYDSSRIFILPSYTEGFPKVISESLARLKPIIIFEEIKHILDNRNGIFICKRNKRNIDKTINYIFKNYKKIQKEISKNNFYTKDNFKKELLELTNNEFRN